MMDGDGRTRVKLAGVALSVAALAACTSISFDGRWVGVCETTDLGMRVDATVYEVEDDDAKRVTAVVFRPDRRGESLSLDCATVVEEDSDAEVSGCRGSWDGTDAEHDLDLSGTLEARDLADRLRGDCTSDGLSGDLELWRLPW